MPDVQAYAARFRGSYSYTGWLSTPAEDIVLEGTITSEPDYPVLALSYTGTDGDYTDVQEGMEIGVFPASGGYGRLRVAAGGATATTLNVNEVSKSRIDLSSGGTFHVLRSFRLRDKLVGANSTFPKDSRIEYDDQNWNVAPQVIDGGHYAAIWRGANIPVQFHGSLSLPVDADSVPGDLTHAWVVYGPDATTSSASDPVFTFTGPGTNWVRHTVTDTKAGAAWVKWSAVVIDDPATAIPVRLDSGATASYKEGGTMPIRALANAGIDKLPDGALVIYHEDEVIGGVAGSYGGRVESRSRVKFVGFLLSHTLTLDAERGTLTFEIASPLRILQSLPGFSQAITEVFPAEPANWQQYEYPNHFTILVYLARWHTTLMDLFDTDFGGLRLSMPDNFIQQQTPAAQMQEIADAVDYVLTCARDGAVLVRYEMGVMGTADRSATDVLFHLTDADVLEVQELTYQHRPTVSQLIGRAFANGQPIESISGEAPGEGSENSVVERKIAFSQFGTDYSLNERVGRHFALLNKTYFGVPVPRLVLRLRGSYDFIDPALQQWLLLTLNRTVAGRAVSFNGARLWVESVAIEHGFEADDYGTEVPVKYVVVTAWGETDGFPGVTVNLDRPEPVLDGFPYLVFGRTRIMYVNRFGVKITSNFLTTDTAPTWTQMLFPMNVGEAIFAGVQSPADPHTIVTATGESGTARLRVVENAVTTPSAAYTHTLPVVSTTLTTSTGFTLQIERGNPQQVYIMAAVGLVSSRQFYCIRSGDGGATISSAVAIGDPAPMGWAYNPPLLVLPFATNVAYTIALSGSSYVLFKTTNGGASWSVSSDYVIPDLPAITIQQSIDDPSSIIVGCAVDDSGFPIYRCTASAATLIDANGSGIQAGLRVVDGFPDRLIDLGILDYIELEFPSAARISDDGGDNWTTLYTFNLYPQHPRAFGAVAGADGRGIYTWRSDGIWFFPDWAGAPGNLITRHAADFFSTGDIVLNLYGW